jgi:hypothetical protein
LGQRKKGIGVVKEWEDKGIGVAKEWVGQRNGRVKGIDVAKE